MTVTIMKVAIKTLGCRLNQAESQEILEALLLQGIQLVSFKNKADLYLINSCAVTNAALRKSRQIINFIKNKHPKAKILACGCAKDLKKEVDLFFEDKEEIPKKILKYFLKKKNKISYVYRVRDKVTMLETKKEDNIFRTRAFVKIQEGCDNFCTYCIVPYLRGRPRSISAEEIICKIRQKVEEGYKEIVLSGVNIGKYSSKISNSLPLSRLRRASKLQTLSLRESPRSGTNGFQISDDQNLKLITKLSPRAKNPELVEGESRNFINLTKLLKLLLNQTEIQRIRLGSINPEDIDDEFINLFKNLRMCHHLHLSLQSGSDEVLARMGRRYTTKQYQKIVRKFYQKYPDFNFTTDIIVGFPGETKTEFCQTYNFVKKIGFSKVHIFRYSKRAGTAATKMRNQITEKIKLARAKKLEALNRVLKKNFIKKIQRRYEEVLFENKKQGKWYGFTRNYLRVRIKSGENLRNEIKKIRLSEKILVK